MAQAPALPARLPYQPKLFVGQRGEDVGRSQQVKHILQKAAYLLQDQEEVEAGRVTVFSGEVGLGKTWLLRQLAHELQQPPFAAAFLVHEIKVSKANSAEVSPNLMELELRIILHHLAEKIQIAPAALDKSVTLPELSRQVMEATRQQLQEYCLAILIDEVFEADWSFLELLEEYLLGPLAIEKKVLIVMAGRGRKFPWATPELRFSADFIDLAPFDLPATQEQIRRCHPDAFEFAAEIREFSQGIPLTTSLLAQDHGMLAHQQPEALDPILNRILEPVLTAHAELRQLVEALSVLTGFDDDRIAILSNAYLQTKPPVEPAVAKLLQRPGAELRRDLIVTGLAHFDREEGIHCIDPHLRALAEAYLKQETPTRWRALHQAAFALYQEWRDKYPRNAARWQAQMEHHQAALADKNVRVIE